MKAALLIDGGHLRACAKAAHVHFDNAFIESFAHLCISADEYLLRIFYYDSPQFRGTVQLPVSGTNTQFQSSDKWLRDLAKLDRFAVRRGTLGFRGWKPKTIPVHGGTLTDAEFSPIFEQKGVDMRIGLDIATFSEKRTVDRVILVSGDTDMVPAMKHARKAGLEVVTVQLAPPSTSLHDDLRAHSDFIRAVPWPQMAK
jgi:uncharacterized LabA/DUF88 family protein